MSLMVNRSSSCSQKFGRSSCCQCLIKRLKQISKKIHSFFCPQKPTEISSQFVSVEKSNWCTFLFEKVSQFLKKIEYILFSFLCLPIKLYFFLYRRCFPPKIIPFHPSDGSELSSLITLLGSLQSSLQKVSRPVSASFAPEDSSGVLEKTWVRLLRNLKCDASTINSFVMHVFKKSFFQLLEKESLLNDHRSATTIDISEEDEREMWMILNQFSELFIENTCLLNQFTDSTTINLPLRERLEIYFRGSILSKWSFNSSEFSMIINHIKSILSHKIFD